MFGFGGGNGSFRPGMGMQGGNMTMPARNYGGAPSPGFGGEQIMPHPYGGPMPQPGGMPQQNYGQAAQGMANQMSGYGQMGAQLSGQMGGYGMGNGAAYMANRFTNGMPSQIGFQQGMGGSPMLDAGRRYLGGGMPAYGGNMTMPAQYGGPMPQPGGMPQHNPGIEYGGMPSPDGGAVHNPGIPQRQFANGNPFYNARGNLRMRYRNGGMPDPYMGGGGY